MIRFAGRVCVVLLCVCLVCACDRFAQPREAGEIVVAIRKGPAAYQPGEGAAGGFEHDLIEAFAASQGLKPRYLVAADQNELLNLLRAGKADIAASATVDADGDFLYTRPVLESEQVLVRIGDTPGISTGIEDLAGTKVSAMSASPQAEILKYMAGDPPHFTLAIRSGVAEFDLLREVAERRVDFAATDLLQYHLALRYLPDLEIARTLPGGIRYGWAFSRENSGLRERANLFIRGTLIKNGLLPRLTDKYFGNLERVSIDGLSEFFQKMRLLLPRYRREFQSGQAASGVDWRLLAAVAYQESKWDPLATSPTNVRGIMMLTEETADRMRVSNRLDAAQSIRAGAIYLADLKDMLPDEAREPDRTWLALAAYNLGMGHLNAARAIALRKKSDPDSWYDMKKVLPLLARPEYYEHLKSGMGRGGEAVIMVENIRTYFDILSRFEPAWQPPLQPPPSLSTPPIQGRKAFGTVTLPSAF